MFLNGDSEALTLLASPAIRLTILPTSAPALGSSALGSSDEGQRRIMGDERTRIEPFAVDGSLALVSLLMMPEKSFLFKALS
jgi:hypothetical protein